MKHILMALLLAITPLASADQATTRLESYIQSYPVVTDQQLDIELDQLLTKMNEEAEGFRYFMEGPTDDGTDNPKRDDWFAENMTRAQDAHGLVQDYLKMPSDELNFFTLEMMDRYLNEPDSRLPLREVFNAFSGLKFNDAYLNQVDMSQDWRPIFGTGFAGAGGITLMVLCIRKRSMCSKLARQADFVRNVRRKARQMNKVKDVRKLTGKQYVAELRRMRGLSRGIKNETLGSAISKKSFYYEYAKLGLRARMRELSYIAVAGGGMGGLFLGGQIAYNNFREGKYEYTELNPEELELKYFGALAVLELSCQAKELLKKEDATYNETRDFLLNTHRELQVLGRMAGSLRVYDKTLLDFATPFPDTQQIRADISLADDKEIEHFISCPGVENMGANIHVSLGELEDLVKDVTAKALSFGEAAESETAPQD